MLPYGLDSNVTQILANMLTKPSVFRYLPIVSCNLVSIKLLLLLLLLLLLYRSWGMILKAKICLGGKAGKEGLESER